MIDHFATLGVGAIVRLFRQLIAASSAAIASLLLFATPAFASEPIRNVHYAYDIMGRQLTAKFDSVTGADGITNSYNGFGELLTSQVKMGTFSKTLTSAYDCAGRRIQLTHADSQAFAYAYDALSRLSGVHEGAAAAGCPSAAPSGSALDTFAYGNNGLPVSRAEGAGSGVGYTWDDAGRLIGQTDAFAGGTGNVGWTFGYNPASQIITETRDNDAYAWTGAVAVNRNYAVNGLNQYTSAGPASFTYDPNGNLITDGTSTYLYDVENRLVKATTGSVVTNLVYDPLGRLFQVDKGTNATTTKFVYDGDALVAEYNYNGGTLKARYVHGSNAAADDPLVWYTSTSSGSKKWLHADHLGSIVAATNASGGSPTINTYDEYGIPGSANTGRFQYTGQAWIGELGMYYYKARIYSPTLGRFLQTDPIGYDDQINLYAYVGNDPVNATDPTGQVIAVRGTEADRRLLEMAIRAVGNASPALRGRLITLATSKLTHTVSFGVPEGNGAASSKPIYLRGAQNGTGSNTEIVIGEFYRFGTDSLSRDVKTMVAHELFGHGFDSDQGQLNREINPATGLRFSEESAMAAENNFNKSAGRDPQRNRGDKPLPEWSVSGDLITGNRAQGTRIGCDQKETNVC